MTLSNCRYCDASLDDEEIVTALSRHELYSNYTPEQLDKTARMYGWTPENKKCFRRDVIIQFPNDPQIEICPDCKGVFPRNANYPKRYHETIPGDFGIRDPE